jgi:hypothetical protein
VFSSFLISSFFPFLSSIFSQAANISQQGANIFSLAAKSWREIFKVRLVSKKQNLQGAKQSPRSKVKAKK